MLEAHAAAVKAYKKAGIKGRIGVALDSEWTLPVDPEKDTAAAQRYIEYRLGVRGPAVLWAVARVGARASRAHGRAAADPARAVRVPGREQAENVLPQLLHRQVHLGEARQEMRLR